jgi:hypothetical protein
MTTIIASYSIWRECFMFKATRTFSGTLSIGTVDNTPEGREIVKLLRDVLRPYGKIHVRGRCPNREEIKKQLGPDGHISKSDTPLKFARELAIYFRNNPGITDNQIPSYWSMDLKELREIRKKMVSS